VGQTVHTLSGQPNVVLRLEGNSVIVGTSRSPAGQSVPIELVQAGMDRLIEDGEVRVDVETLGYRSAFVGAVLLTIPGARAEVDPARVVIPAHWALRPGETIRRVDLHARFGGSRQSGISPSRSTPNVFIFSDPSRGEQHGYHDEWEDGVFRYAGEGQQGDQTLTGGNRAILSAASQGRELRIFWGAGGVVEYAGEFTLDEDDPYEWVKAPSTGGGPLRQVVRFHLQPVGVAIAEAAVVRRRAAQAGAQQDSFATSYRPANEQAATAPRDPFDVDPDAVDRALRSHASIQNSLESVVRNHGCRTFSPGSGDPDFDLAWEQGGEVTVAEVKSVTAGNETKQLRLGLGQLLDYVDRARRSGKRARGVLAVEAEPADPRWVELCAEHGIMLVWPTVFEALFADEQSE